jgi:hypothetical protein
MAGMFSLFRKTAAAPETVLPGTPRGRRMSLAERIAFRRDLADQVVRECLQTLSVMASQYRHRLMPLDPRQHRYVVMLDVAAGFAPRQDGRAWVETEVEALMRRHAYERYGLSFEGIYWRVGAQEDTQPLERRGHLHAVPRTGDSRPWQQVSDEEKQALMEAIREGSERPVLHVGELEYQTDLAPLDDPSGRRSQPRGKC